MRRTFMKGFILLIVVGSVILSGDMIGLKSEANAQIQPKLLGVLLIELENAVLWSAVRPEFRSRQQDWRKECLAAHSGAEFARLLTEFESWVLWSAVDGKWKKRRDSWIKDVRSAGSSDAAGTLGKLLAEFESNVLWSAVDSINWKVRRDSWINDCSNGKL